MDAPEKLMEFRRSNWHTLPDDMRRELRIWLAMPGFSIRYHVEALGHEPRLVKQFMGAYEELKDEVLENWASATKEDCIKLGYLRPEKGDLPLITKLEIRREYMRGSRQNAIAEEFGVAPATVNKLCWSLPDEVDHLPSDLYRVLADDRYLNAMSKMDAGRFRLPRIGEHTIWPESAVPPEMQARLAEMMARVPAYEDQKEQQPVPSNLDPIDEAKLLAMVGRLRPTIEPSRGRTPVPEIASEEMARIIERMVRLPVYESEKTPQTTQSRHDPDDQTRALEIFERVR
jgi:hypothetical protein